MKKGTLSILILLLISSLSFAQGPVKKADLAGSWYPKSPEKLSKMLDGYNEKAELENIPSGIKAVIVPHAGYIYSGSVAAYAYKAVSGMEIDTIILIGFSHRRYYNAISVYDRGSFETPLGPLPIDEGLAQKLILSHDKFYFNAEAFKDENSVELELPFIRHAFKDKKIKIVPIAIGVQSYENARILADSLYELLKDKDKFLIVASTDLSHFHPYGEANAIDGLAIETIRKFDPKELFDKTSFEKCEFCGIGPVVAAMIAAKKLGANSVEILKYANSGDTAGRKDNVVGYLSAALYKNGQKADDVATKEEKETGMLTEEQKNRLIQIARETMEAYIKTGKRLDFKEDDSLFNREMGAFVTIHKKGQLRGCIGNIIGRGPLYLTVKNMAIESSTGDPRFSPVSVNELEDIDIEISVLSELEKITDPNTIEIGKHGVLVRKGFRSGVYLPQVGTETGWSREEFMNSLCASKAGLPQDAWKKGEVDIYVFTAEVFGEVKH